MRTAPAARIDIGCDRRWPFAVAMVAAVAAANLSVWLGQRLDAPIALTCAGAVVGALASALAGRRWPGTATGKLVWDGVQWSWAASGHEPRSGDLQAMLDLGSWLLLRFEGHPPALRPVWLSVARDADKSAWHALRTAVYSRRLEQPDTFSRRGLEASS